MLLSHLKHFFIWNFSHRHNNLAEIIYGVQALSPDYRHLLFCILHFMDSKWFIVRSWKMARIKLSLLFSGIVLAIILMPGKDKPHSNVSFFTDIIQHFILRLCIQKCCLLSYNMLFMCSTEYAFLYCTETIDPRSLLMISWLCFSPKP